MIAISVAFGDRDALITAVQERINHKTEKRQLDDAPGLKWLAVMLDGGHPAGRFNDHFGLRANPPYPLEMFSDLTYRDFDEVWVVARSEGETHAAVRLGHSPGYPERHIFHSDAASS